MVDSCSRWFLAGLVAAAGGCTGARSYEPSGPVANGAAALPPPASLFSQCTSGLPDYGMWKCDPIFADVNGDGHIDMAALARKGRGPRVWLGNSAGEWTESSTGLATRKGSCGGGLSFADVNRDNYADLIVADHCFGIFVFLGDGGGQWERVTSEMHPSDRSTGTLADESIGAEDVAVGDVDGDGFADIVAGASDEGGVNVYLGDGTGRNWTREQNSLPYDGWANRVMLADMNNDQRLDIFAAFHKGPRVWLNGGNGNWIPASNGLPSPIITGLYTGIDVGDIDKDGRIDLATANWTDGPEVYLQQVDGSWKKTPDVFPEMMGGAVGAALGDIDADGDLDMVVSGRLQPDPGFVRGVFLLHGDGAGTWTLARHSGIPSTGLAATSGVALEDVTGDGLLDVAAASGLIVESAAGPKKPIVPARLLVWCSGGAEVDSGSSTASNEEPSSLSR